MEFEEIYAGHAEEYDALVQAEDCDGNLIPSIETAHPLSGAAVLEVGVGTGRIARGIVARVDRLVAVDRAAAMLRVAHRHLSHVGRAAPWTLCQADARALPVRAGWADVAIAGWVFGHFREWMPDDWRAQVARAVGEMRRALRQGGTLVVIETLGTGREEPAAPTPELAEYFTWLERVLGFERTAIRTDYQFRDVASAATITGFFFGEELAALVRREAWTHIPECTGIWSLRV
jgi:ubiquinone/menaquinone biosynthesis C-methylase UbiE